ncbi:MAG: TonB C-terminal domain-containing protein [Deltaproteobacteria bacterium]|nr:TonB C-terminal domain-containing protein [Deltaproteobacteria bacterium]
MASFTFENLFGGEIDPKLKRMVAVSAFMHLTLFALILIMARNAPLPVNYQASIQVALVDLPEVNDLEQVKLGAPKPKQLPPPEAKKPEPKAAEKAKPAEPKKKIVALEEAKKTEQKAADTKAKKEPVPAARMDSAVNRLRVQNTAIARIRQRALDTAMPEGTAGGNVRGIGALKGLAYDALVRGHLEYNWELPPTFLGQHLNTQVYMKIDRDGRLIEWKIVRGSGNSVYDDTVYRAFRKIELGQGFPRPEPEIYDSMLKEGYVIDMKAEDFFS